jgi:hypothetical protein
MPTIPTKSARSITAKFETLNQRSAEVTNGLRKLPNGAELYEQAQAAERALRMAKQVWDEQDAAVARARTSMEEARKRLLTFCKATVTLTEAMGISGAAAVLAADDKDEAALAANMVDFARQLPLLGDGLAQALEARRAEWLTTEVAMAHADERFQHATRLYGEAFYRATATIAQGKALLMASGVWVMDRKSPKKKTAAKPGSEGTVVELPQVKTEPALLAVG